MVQWSRFSPDELERRRLLSVEGMAQNAREAFADWYQEQCDRLYWTTGKCCAGCDHWRSDMGMTGQCAAAGIMSGAEVIRSLGWQFCSYTPPPGLPFSDATFSCGKFSDAFDWSTLEPEYLARIGAMRNGKLRPTPSGCGPIGETE